MLAGWGAEALQELWRLPSQARWGLGEGESWVMSRSRRYPPELLERGVRMVEESGGPIAHVARDLGVTSEVLRKRVRQAEADRGERPAMLSTSEREELRTLRREVAQLRWANAIVEGRDGVFCSGARSDPANSPCPKERLAVRGRAPVPLLRRLRRPPGAPGRAAARRPPGGRDRERPRPLARAPRRGPCRGAGRPATAGARRARARPAP